MTHAPDEITRLLNAWAKGDQTAAEKLFPLIVRELRQIAEKHMRQQPPGHILQTTELVHEAYLKLASGSVKSWKDRGHFFAVASMAMRHILIDHARKDLRHKRGAGRTDLPLDEAAIIPVEQSGWLIALDDALNTFAELDHRAAQVVVLRFFGGLSVEETAEVLGISRATVQNDWRAARLWLMREIEGKGNGS
jgi:RNA polymerase sigma factor (TIGR02999 family)